VSVAPLTDM